MVNPDNNRQPIQIEDSSVINRYFIVLHYRQNDKFNTLLICHDRLSAEQYRQLVIQIRLSKVLLTTNNSPP